MKECWYEKYKVDVPEGESGDWKIEKFTVDDNDLSQQLSAIKYGRSVPGGTYTRLTHHNDVVMSDTPDEIKDHLSILYNASGNILIAGLGLGMVVGHVASKEEVTHVTVIENSSDVIKLVAHQYKDKYKDKIEIIEADIFKWKPDKTAYYDYAWYDIWNTLCLDNLEEMTRLHRKFGKKTGWQNSWGRDYLKYRKRQERNSYYF